jgi:lysophospholipase L1-like esterase
MHIQQKILSLFIVTAFSCISSTGTLTNKQVYTAKGRTEILEGNNIALIGSASSVTFGFKGNRCTVNLSTKDTYEHHNYAVIEVDGQYYSREMVQPSGTSVTVMVKDNEKHTITVYKATEASNGTLIFKSAEGDKEKPKKKIEFIGDSITCGMGNDTLAMPCGRGLWFDQHNAYYSYAPIAARSVGADYILSSVSGIGMYRNWNDEHDKEAIMPDVYENLYLNKDSSKPYKFGFAPDVTCIALGTNDFSDGDHKKERLPFNEDKYIGNYINFINTIYKHSPKTQIVLLSSPMVTGERSATFIKCLEKIKDQVNSERGHKEVKLFTFSAVTPHGCGSHPEIEDDKLMAAQLAPYLKTLLNEK